MQIQKTSSSSTNESSVLISLAALGAMAQPARAAKPVVKEELFAIGTTPLAPLAAPMVTAPIAQPPKSATRPWIAGALIVASVILGGSYVGARAMQRPAVVLRAPVVQVSESASESESESESESPTVTVEATTTTPTTSTTTTTTAPHPRPHRDPVATTTPTTPPPAVPHERTIEELLEAPLCCGHTAATTAHVAPTTPALPTTPSRDDVMTAMRGVSVSQCGPEHGIATVRITVASTGRVSSAVVTGPLEGTPAGSCVARAARDASFPRFAQSSFVFSYPFRI